jgi:tRNA(fMet)-specific endonuclease VapC
MTVSELLVGVFRADSAQRRALRELFVEGILASFPVIPFEVDAARTHASLSARLAKAGTKLDAHDLIIGATALTHGYSMLTENVRDFGRVPGLVVRRPVWS